MAKLIVTNEVVERSDGLLRKNWFKRFRVSPKKSKQKRSGFYKLPKSGGLRSILKNRFRFSLD